MKIYHKYLLLLSLTLLSFGGLSGTPSVDNRKNVLFLNSYHQGYAWTDSLTSGVNKASKLYPEINIFTESLNSKQFGQLNFEIEKDYYIRKYKGIKFDGVLVTDNDALEFAFQYDQELFPNIPIVYTGISNPEEYPLNGSLYYGLKETGSSEYVLALVRRLMPQSKRLFVITDKTTTGQVYRKEFTADASKLDHFSVMFPECIELDSIYRKVSSGKDFDAIFYAGINQDNKGQLVDPVRVIQEISKLATVPIFTNDPLKNCEGILGGLFRSGELHGSEAVNLLIKLINEPSVDSFKHIYTTEQRFFFDRRLLDKYQIPIKRLPPKSKVFNQKILFTRENFVILLSVLALLSFAIVVLLVVYRIRSKEHKKSKIQLFRIRSQKDELEEAYHKLSDVISELENTNERLNESNINLKEAKKKAVESDNLKSAFLANVSHEIRTPLNSIVGFSSLLSDPNLTEETRSSYTELIESNSESLLVLIDEIIDLSKIEAQQLTLKKQNFSVDILLSELFQVFSQIHKNSKIELKVRNISETKDLFVYSDRVRVNQVFVNLLSNAYKFTESGSIEFGYFEAENNEIQLFVRDSGIGIKEEYHEVIFDRFRKLNTNDSKLYSGTGLGLAITKKLVELLGGKIWINSEPGKGTIFFFTLDSLELKDMCS